MTTTDEMAATQARRPRADAARNRERLLEAAKRVFGAGGPDASLEAVAREAGVGIGTLYRHFPTREALFEAVYRREVDQLAELAETLRGHADPVAALRQWMHANVELIATKKGMLAALALAVHASSDIVAYSVGRLGTALGLLLARAVEAGALRDELEPQDLLRAIVGLCYTNDRPDWRERVLRMVDVLVDGLRRPAG